MPTTARIMEKRVGTLGSPGAMDSMDRFVSVKDFRLSHRISNSWLPDSKIDDEEECDECGHLWVEHACYILCAVRYIERGTYCDCPGFRLVTDRQNILRGIEE
jgi:hypothetical protein